MAAVWVGCLAAVVKNRAPRGATERVMEAIIVRIKIGNMLGVYWKGKAKRTLGTDLGQERRKVECGCYIPGEDLSAPPQTRLDPPIFEKKRKEKAISVQ